MDIKTVLGFIVAESTCRNLAEIYFSYVLGTFQQKKGLLIGRYGHGVFLQPVCLKLAPTIYLGFLNISEYEGKKGKTVMTSIEPWFLNQLQRCIINPQTSLYKWAMVA